MKTSIEGKAPSISLGPSPNRAKFLASITGTYRSKNRGDITAAVLWQHCGSSKNAALLGECGSIAHTAEITNWTGDIGLRAGRVRMC
jgi:hypothetical protein